MQYAEEVITLNRNVEVYSGLKLMNQLVVRKEQDTPLAMVTAAGNTVTMIYADTVLLEWLEVGDAIDECWAGLEKVVLEASPDSEVQGVLFRDADNPKRVCMVAYPKGSSHA